MLSPEIKNALLSARPFKYLETHELDMLLAYCKIVSFKDKEIVLQQGKKSEGMYIIIEGKALMIARTLGKDIINLATLEQGNFIGEESLIETGQSLASILAEGKLQCLLITTAYFDMLSIFFPETRHKISKAITEAVCGRVKYLFNKIGTIMKESDMIQESIFYEIIKPFTKPERISLEKASEDLLDLYHKAIFKNLSKEEYDELLKHVTFLQAPNYCNLINKGEKDTPFFIILNGAVQASVTENNKIAKLCVLAPVCLFGGMSFIDESSSMISYTTCERSIILEIKANEFPIIQKNNIYLWYKIYDLICKSFVALEQAADKLQIRLHSELYNR